MGKILITVLGSDRPGIIAAVSQALFKRDCNIENVSQTVLQSEFASLWVATAPDSLSPRSIEQDLGADLRSLGLDVHVKELASRPEAREEPGESFLITTMGPDDKGLVARITGVMAGHGANVTNLKAVFRGGDDPGRNIMVYEVHVPNKADTQALGSDLRAKARELGLEITIQHKKIFDVINKI